MLIMDLFFEKSDSLFYHFNKETASQLFAKKIAQIMLDRLGVSDVPHPFNASNTSPQLRQTLIAAVLPKISSKINKFFAQCISNELKTTKESSLSLDCTEIFASSAKKARIEFKHIFGTSALVVDSHAFNIPKNYYVKLSYDLDLSHKLKQPIFSIHEYANGGMNQMPFSIKNNYSVQLLEEEERLQNFDAAQSEDSTNAA